MDRGPRLPFARLGLALVLLAQDLHGLQGEGASAPPRGGDPESPSESSLGSTPGTSGDAIRARAHYVAPDALALDGHPGEWTAAREESLSLGSNEQLVPLGERAPTDDWTGWLDASLRLWVGWNHEDLILGGIVLDEVVIHDPLAWHRGDSLELFINAVDAVPAWGADDYQLMLSPLWLERPWGVYGRGNQRVPGSSHGGFGGVEVAHRKTEGGYWFEARIPWENFGGLEVDTDSLIPFNFALTDRDVTERQDSYLTWTGESRIAEFADRRGRLELHGSPPEGEVQGSVEDSGGLLQDPWLLGLLVLAYGGAFATRGLWRTPRNRWRMLAVSGVLAIVAMGSVFLARANLDGRRAEQGRELAETWASFETLLRGGALGHPEPGALLELSSALLSGAPVRPVDSFDVHHVRGEAATAGEELRTALRGIPYRPLGPPDGLAATSPTEWEELRELGTLLQDPGGIFLEPGEVLDLDLEQPVEGNALHVILRVSARSWHQVARSAPVFVVQATHGGAVTGTPFELRHDQEVGLDDGPLRDRPGLESAWLESGGRTGRRHAVGLVLPFEGAVPMDGVRLVHQGLAPYAVQIVALGALVARPAEARPGALQATADGDWVWSAHRPEIQATVLPRGRAPREGSAVRIHRELRLGAEVVGDVYLEHTEPLPIGGLREVLPLALGAGLAPFVVAMLAEWLASRRRIRWKLGIGFGISSAVPLLALTLLLDAALAQEHRSNDGSRIEADLARAEGDLDRQVGELEGEATRLLEIARLQMALAAELEPGSAPFPEDPELLAGWWGEPSPDEVSWLERDLQDGTRERMGTGRLWRQIPAADDMGSGLLRLWGRLYACGVARSPSGVDPPLSVVVARPPELSQPPTPGGEAPRLMGAGRDPEPTMEDLRPRDRAEVRRAVYGADGKLAGVLVARGRARGTPLLASWSLTDLLLAAGITALFTALLFAGILTTHLVRPIEHLDRAVREGLPEPLRIHVPDEVGNLTSAIQAFADEVAHRVDQLETLQVAQEEMSSRLDAELAREAVLQFFRESTGARSSWIVWQGRGGEEPALHGVEAVVRALPPGHGLLRRALVAGRTLHVVDRLGMPSLVEAERVLFGEVRRVLSLPLLAGGDVRGALLLGFESDREPSDQAFLRTAAAQAAIVLENADLYHRAVTDAATGFATDPGFRIRLAEEIQRAEGQGHGGVTVVRVRLRDLPQDDAAADARLREAARRLRGAVRGMAIFGRSGAADLQVALPFGGGAGVPEEVVERILRRLGGAPWSDGEVVRDLQSAVVSWPTDGPSGRFLMARLEERLEEVSLGSEGEAVSGGARPLPGDFIAESPLFLELLSTAAKLAGQDVSVLVSGETGTGKDRLAELIHAWSPRAGGPILKLPCATLPPTLVEDELFGHEVGAFTGAVDRRRGPFELAQGGTLVLDEVAELAPEAQVALLRVLETREVQPLGSTQSIPVDVRVVATTSTDLARAVEEGRFRGDLYFRLNVAQLLVPPLRLRRAALPKLVRTILERFGGAIEGEELDTELLDRLYEHPWPGNLRELENVIRRALVLDPEGVLRAEHLDLSGAPSKSGAGVAPGGTTAGAQARSGSGNSPASDDPPTRRQLEILGDLDPGNELTTSSVSARLGVSSRTALRDLKVLVRMGYLVQNGQKRGTRFRRTERPLAGSGGAVAGGIGSPMSDSGG